MVKEEAWKGLRIVWQLKRGRSRIHNLTLGSLFFGENLHEMCSFYSSRDRELSDLREVLAGGHGSEEKRDNLVSMYIPCI